jgi:hypothetical protein
MVRGAFQKLQEYVSMYRERRASTDVYETPGQQSTWHGCQEDPNKGLGT